MLSIWLIWRNLISINRCAHLKIHSVTIIVLEQVLEKKQPGKMSEEYSKNVVLRDNVDPSVSRKYMVHTVNVWRDEMDTSYEDVCKV